MHAWVFYPSLEEPSLAEHLCVAASIFCGVACCKQRAPLGREVDKWIRISLNLLDRSLCPPAVFEDCLNAIAPVLPEFMGGSADLAPSNMTLMTLGPMQALSAAMSHGQNLYKGDLAGLYTGY